MSVPAPLTKNRSPLYERIIKASSNEGDLVLDPFCGCATTIIAARNLNRRWIGIDRRPDARYHVVCRMAGISADERKRLEELPNLANWLNKQMGKHEAHYNSEPPVRTDRGDTAAPALAPVFPVAGEFGLTHKEMHGILIKQFGLQCWGCDFIALDGRYLELDHIDPRSSGGSNQLDNRALLCRPCNQTKSNHLTLVGLWRENSAERLPITKAAYRHSEGKKMGKAAHGRANTTDFPLTTVNSKNK